MREWFFSSWVPEAVWFLMFNIPVSFPPLSALTIRSHTHPLEVGPLNPAVGCEGAL